MKVDPYNNKQSYEKWKEKVKSGDYELSKANSELILGYLQDMEMGMNIANGSKKGSRSYSRLNALKGKLAVLMNKIQEMYKIDDCTDITEEQLHSLFLNMREGKIKRYDGKEYKSVGDYVKDFKSFWHWYQKSRKKQGKIITDITTDLDTSKEKPQWVYLNEEQIRELANNSKFVYRVLIWFLYDTGIRSPTELLNLRVSDISKDYSELNIRDEVSKTFGRKIKLMFCRELLKEYIKTNNLTDNSHLFDINYYNTNKYLKNLGKRLFGENKSLAGEKYSKLSLYDFRHNSACYWLPKYPTQQGMMYRFGWKKADKILYYTELLGMKDNINEINLISDVSKTEKERELVYANNEISFLKERTEMLERELRNIMQMNKKILEELKGGHN